MSDLICGYTGDREAMLMAYLYEEIALDDRDGFEAHLGTCARCRVEIHALRRRARRNSRGGHHRSSPVTGRWPSHRAILDQYAGRSTASWRWRELPGLGASGRGGPRSSAYRPASPTSTSATTHKGLEHSHRLVEAETPPTSTALRAAADAVSHDELVKLEQQLTGRSSRRATSAPRPPRRQRSFVTSGGDADVVRRITSLGGREREAPAARTRAAHRRTVARRQRAAPGRSAEDRSEPRRRFRTTSASKS